MKSYNRLFAGICVLLFVVVVLANVWLFTGYQKNQDRPYLVEISRLAAGIQERLSGGEEVTAISDPKGCQYVKQVVLCEKEEQLCADTKYDYCIRQIEGKLYRFEYAYEPGRDFKTILLPDAILIGMSILVMGLLLYIRARIIVPFQQLEQIPFALAKGNLTLDLKEHQTKYFGKFIWGINMLRESLEERRQKELNLQRKKKLLLLSLTHDIKTPLSVIKLNAQALQRGLYQETERQKEAAASISEKVDEIERYVSEITAASRDDFLDLSVVLGEFYLSDVIEKIKDHYEEKLALRKTEFIVETYGNCILAGDKNRLAEVLQNIMDNAIKYGDGEKITISFGREEGCCLIAVTNTGATLKTDEIPKIFDSFYRGSNAGSQSGSGLGLYICRRLMNNMNGDIFVKEDEHTFTATVVVRLL